MNGTRFKKIAIIKERIGKKDQDPPKIENEKMLEELEKKKRLRYNSVGP